MPKHFVFFQTLLFQRIFYLGKGIYTTDNFDVYDAEWDNDAFANSEIYIR